MVEGIRLVGREPAGRDVGEDGHGGPELRRRGLADALPEAVEVAPRLRPATGDQAGRHHDGVDRPGIRAADGVDDEVVLLQQPVEDAPGEGAERAAALECQREGARRPRCAMRVVRRRSVGAGIGSGPVSGQGGRPVPGRSAGSAAPDDRLCSGTASRRPRRDSATAPKHRIPTTASSDDPRRRRGACVIARTSARRRVPRRRVPWRRVPLGRRRRAGPGKRPPSRGGTEAARGVPNEDRWPWCSVSVEETGWIPRGDPCPEAARDRAGAPPASRRPSTPSWVRRWTMQGRKSPVGVGP